MSAWAPRALSLLRIVAALLFMEHGLMKLFHFPIAQPGVPDPLPALLIAAASIEIVAGALLAIGLFTRVAAFVAWGEMAVAYFLGHATQGFWPGVNGGSEAILYSFNFFYLAFAGGGAWSMDAVRDRARLQARTTMYGSRSRLKMVFATRASNAMAPFAVAEITALVGV